LQLKNQVKYLGVIQDAEGHHCLLEMSKGDKENMGTEIKGCVLDIHFGGDTHFDLSCLIVVEKASQISVNRKTVNLQRLSCVGITESMHSTLTAAPKVILMLPTLGIYIKRERGKAGDLQTELFWRIYSSKIWPFGDFRKDD
jgi:hypothetical protein